MRWFLPSIMLIAVVLWFGATSDVLVVVEADSSASKNLRTDWRETAHGWQKMKPELPSEPNSLEAASRVHPAIVGVLQLLLSLGALVAFGDLNFPRRGSRSDRA